MTAMWPCRKNEGVVLDYGYCGSVGIVEYSEGSKMTPVTPRLEEKGNKLSFVGRPEYIWRAKPAPLYGEQLSQPLISSDKPYVRSILTSLIPDAHVPADVAAELARDQSKLLAGNADPLMGRPLAWGKAAGSRQTRLVDCLLYPTGPTNSALRVDRGFPETINLHCGHLDATVFSSQSCIFRQHNSIAFDFKTPIAQIQPACSRWSLSEERDSSRTAVRTLGGSTFIFRLQYHGDGSFVDQMVEVDPSADFSSSLLSTPRHSDVTFNPWYSRQLAIVDDRAVMSLWDITAGASSTLTETSVADGISSGDAFKAPLICWGPDMNTILYSPGSSLSLIDARSTNVYRDMDILGPSQASSGIALDDRRIFDISKSPYNDHDCFTLTSNEIVWIDLRMTRPLLRWRHHLSPHEPMSMLLSTCKPSPSALYENQINAAIYSSSSKGVKVFQFATQNMEELPSLPVSLDDPYSIPYSGLVPSNTQALLLSEPASVRFNSKHNDEDLSSSSVYCMYALSTSQELSQQFLISNPSTAPKDWTFDSRKINRPRKMKSSYRINKRSSDGVSSEEEDAFLNVESEDRFKMNEMQIVDVQRLFEETFSSSFIDGSNRNVGEVAEGVPTAIKPPERSTVESPLAMVRANLTVDQLERWLGMLSSCEGRSTESDQQDSLKALGASLYRELCKWWSVSEAGKSTDKKLADFIVSDVLASCSLPEGETVDDVKGQKQREEEKELRESNAGIDMLMDDWKVEADHESLDIYEWHELGRQPTEGELPAGGELENYGQSSQRIMMALSQQQDYTLPSVRIRQSGLDNDSSQMEEEQISSSQPISRQVTMSQIEPGPYGGRRTSSTTRRTPKRRKVPRAGF